MSKTEANSFDTLSDLPEVLDIIYKSRSASETRSHVARMPWGEHSEMRREGKYPLVSHEGHYHATLWRTIAAGKDSQSFRGGEFRILANDVAVKNTHRNENLRVIVDSIPIFLKELSDTGVQNSLAQARTSVAQSEYPAVLIQNRASDVHDGEFRNRPDGQLDLQEEIWYAKVLNVMKLFPGITVSQAKKILISFKETPYYSDYGLGVSTILHEYYLGRAPQKMQVEVLSGDQFISPFPGEYNEHSDPQVLIQEKANELRKIIEKSGTEQKEDIHFLGVKYSVSTLAEYPIMQNGVEFSAKLVKIWMDGDITFRTYRILQCGDPKRAYLRIDSICTNGVQGGDSHCDCRRQSEVEKERAADGIPMILINIRDDEGRFHGEGMKGGTLAVQRAVNEQIGSLAEKHGISDAVIGNGIAAQLFYHDTGHAVDARTYNGTQVLLKYLRLSKIAHLVTDNTKKIEAVRVVSNVADVTTAVVREGLTHEAMSTYQDKKSGGIPGVIYKYQENSL